VNLKYYIMYLPALLVLLQGRGLSQAGAGPSGPETCEGHEERDALARLISNHEALPGAGMITAHDAVSLKDIALNSCYPAFTRGRAMRLMGLLEGEACAAFLETVLRDQGKSYYLRIEAAHVLKNILERSRPDRLAQGLSLLLKSNDIRLRGTTLHILSELDTPLAKSMIRDHGLVERHQDILAVYYLK